MKLRELTNEEFNNFIENFNINSIYQTKEYSFVMNKTNFETSMIGLFNDDIMVGATLIIYDYIEKFKYAYIPRGYLIDYNNINLLKSFTTLIKKFLNKKNVVGVKISPPIIKRIYDNKGNVLYNNSNFNNIFNNFKKLGYYHLGFNNLFEALKPRFEAIIDLKDKSNTTLFKNIKKEYRTKIRTSSEKGIKIYKGKDSNIDELYSLIKSKYPRGKEYLDAVCKYYNESNKLEYYYAKLDSKSYLDYIQKRFLHYQDLTNKINDTIINNTKTNNKKMISKKMMLDNTFESIKKDLTFATNILRDYPDGVVLASVLIIKNNKEAYLLLDGHNAKFKKFNAKHYLIWSLIEKYHKEGFSAFNLGGITSLDSNDSKYNGLKQFKLNFGADVIEYIGDFELTINKSNYFIFRNKRAIKKTIKKATKKRKISSR